MYIRVIVPKIAEYVNLWGPIPQAVRSPPARFIRYVKGENCVAKLRIGENRDNKPGPRVCCVVMRLVLFSFLFVRRLFGFTFIWAW